MKKIIMGLVLVVLLLIAAGPFIASEILVSAHEDFAIEMEQRPEIDFEYELLEKGYLNSTYRYHYSVGGSSHKETVDVVTHHGPLPWSALGDDIAPFTVALATAGHSIDLASIDNTTIQAGDTSAPVEIVYGLNGDVDADLQLAEVTALSGTAEVDQKAVQVEGLSMTMGGNGLNQDFGFDVQVGLLSIKDVVNPDDMLVDIKDFHFSIAGNWDEETAETMLGLDYLMADMPFLELLMDDIEFVATVDVQNTAAEMTLMAKQYRAGAKQPEKILVDMQGLDTSLSVRKQQDEHVVPDIVFDLELAKSTIESSSMNAITDDTVYQLSLLRNEQDQIALKLVSTSGKSVSDILTFTATEFPLELMGVSASALDQVALLVKQQQALGPFAYQEKQQIEQQMMMIAPELLTADTQLTIDQINYATEDGDIELALDLQFSDQLDMDSAAQMPMLYASGLEGEGKVILPKNVFRKATESFFVMMNQEAINQGVDPADLAMEKSDYEAEVAEIEAFLDGLVAQGFVSFTDGAYRSDLKLSNMQLTANEQAVPLMQMLMGQPEPALQTRPQTMPEDNMDDGTWDGTRDDTWDGTREE